MSSGGKVIIPTYLNKQTSKKKIGLQKLPENSVRVYKSSISYHIGSFSWMRAISDALHIKIDGFIPCSIAIIEKGY